MQEEIFSLGSTSRFIGNQLSNLPAARTRRKVSIIRYEVREHKGGKRRGERAGEEVRKIRRTGGEGGERVREKSE